MTQILAKQQKLSIDKCFVNRGLACHEVSRNQVV